MRNLHSYRLMWLYCFGFCGCEVGRVFSVGGGWGRRVVGLLTAPFFFKDTPDWEAGQVLFGGAAFTWELEERDCLCLHFDRGLGLITAELIPVPAELLPTLTGDGSRLDALTKCGQPPVN